MRLRKIYFAAAAAALALALGSCGGCSPRTTRYALKKAHLTGSQVYYVPAGQFKTVKFNPPPGAESDAQQQDLAATLAWQNKRTENDCFKARETAKADYDFFWGDKSPFPSPLPDEVNKFFIRLESDLGDAVSVMKDRYERLRPYKAYPGQALPCIKKSSGYSYPSGHSSYARVFANVLADIVPARKDEFLEKADEIALDRVIGGVHYKTDIAAGRVFGDLFHAGLLKSEAYKKDIEKMKTLLVR